MSLLHQNPPLFPRLFAYSADPGDSRRWLTNIRVPVGWLLLGMFVLCLIPRLWMGSLVRASCPDAYYYISVASFYQHGKWAQAFVYLDLNFYPIILLALHSLGLEWVVAGKLWSIVISSLAVLPMFGWVRRLFCDQIAWAACFLYCMHSELVELSMEPVRDPTFWFLLNLCLYATIRAISEAKLRWFLLGGLVFALAVHIRSEGWLLLIPFGMWLAKQFFQKIEFRKRLALGGALWLAVTPILIIATNLTILKNEPQWRFGRLNHFVVGWEWLQERLGGKTLEETPAPAQPPVTEAPPTIAGTPKTPSVPKPLETVPPASSERPVMLPFVKEFALAMDHLHLMLMVFGWYWLGRSGWTWDRFAMVLMAAVLAVAVYVLFDHYGAMNGRYFYPIYLVLIPYFASGILVVWNAIWVAARWLSWKRLKPQYAVGFYMTLGIFIGWTDAFTTYHNAREREVDLAEWLDQTYGPFHVVVTDLKSSRTGYHVHHKIPKILHNWGAVEWQYPEEPFDLLMVSCTTTPPECQPLVHAAALRLGLEPVTLPEGHEARDRFMVYVRSQQRHSLATKPESEPQTIRR